MKDMPFRITRKAAKNIDGYQTFKLLARLTRNYYSIRYCNFLSRMLKRCGSIKRIFDFAYHSEFGMYQVFYASRRGYIYSTFIDKRGYYL